MAHAGLSIAAWGPVLTTPRRRWAAGLLASAAIHAAILIPMAFGLLSHPTPLSAVPPPPVYLDIEPRPLLDGETVRIPTPSGAGSRESAPVLGGTVSSLTSPLRRDEEEDRPSAPVPRLGQAPPPGAPTTPADAWRVTPEGMAAAVARSLRTGAGGCRIMDGRLSAAEQALCDERFNEAAGRAGPLGPRTLDASEARREAGFARDGARALAEYEARRRPLSGGVGIVGPGDCPGSNLGVGCAGAHLDPALRQGATTTVNPGLGSNDPEPMRPIPGNE